MNINQLRYFIAVAESCSFSKAAAQFYISQTAITQQIQALEAILGVQLFNRNTRPVTLTPAGQTFLSEAKGICDRVTVATAKVKEVQGGLTGTVKIGYTKGYEYSDLPKILHKFHKKNPNILLHCYRHHTDQLSAGLLNGDYDIIFTWDSTNIVEEKNIEYCLFERVPLLVAMYKTHPLAHRTTISRTDLKNENILYMTPSNTGYSYGDNHFMNLYRQAGYIPNIIFRSNDMESILMMVAAEEGISILPAYGAHRIINMENIVFCTLDGEEEYENIICAWKKDSTNEALNKLIHFIE